MAHAFDVLDVCAPVQTEARCRERVAFGVGQELVDGDGIEGRWGVVNAKPRKRLARQVGP
ncbi:MAG: hypothetical protein AAF624_02860 [Bacteroidota bacterium]